MTRFSEVLPQIRALQDEHAAAHQTRLTEDVALTVAGESARGRQSLGFQVRAALAIAAALLLFATIGTAWYARQQQLRRQRLAMQYEKATACLDNGDYLCALENLDALLRAEPDYPNAQSSLDATRYALAERYVQIRQWEKATTTLETLLEDNPYHIQALSLLENTYTLWIEDAVRQKDWWLAMKLVTRRELRFQ
jgi:predicted Zn-dependent protease